jgi:hypothetical protein
MLVSSFTSALWQPYCYADTGSHEMRNAGSLCSLILLSQLGLSAQTQGAADRAMPMPVTPTRPPSPKAALTPPTEGERIDQYMHDLVNPTSFVAAGVGAGIGQWRDKPKEWGEGGQAFARRFVSGYTQHIVYSTMLFGASSLLHEDNRYVASSETGFGARLKYALESTVLARHYDASGQPHRRLSISRIGAMAGAALLSRLWQPASTGGLQNAAVSFGVSIGAASGFNVTREFMPNLPGILK